jgi:hypothetical protein
MTCECGGHGEGFGFGAATAAEVTPRVSTTAGNASRFNFQKFTYRPPRHAERLPARSATAITQETAMATRDLSTQIRTASGINIVLGIWLIVSPWIYNFAHTAMNATTSSVIVGILV